jgi:hypothetical protein
MKKYIALSLIALCAVGCKNSDGDFAPHPNEIHVEASLVNATRATLTNFEENDLMSLYAVEYNGEEVAQVQTAGNYINNEAMSYNNGRWQSDRTLYWNDKPCDFYGFYPYQPTGPMSDVLFEVATDQSTPKSDGVLGGYEASDIMWAKAENVTRNDGSVRLQFNHMMTRVVVEIVCGDKFEGELPKDIDVRIYNTVTSAIVDWRIGSLEAYTQGGRKTIKMRKLDRDTFDAIVVPQFIQRSTPLIEITMEGIAYLLETSMSFRPGKQHTITVKLNTSPDQEKIEISIDGEVGDWN